MPLGLTTTMLHFLACHSVRLSSWEPGSSNAICHAAAASAIRSVQRTGLSMSLSLSQTRTWFRERLGGKDKWSLIPGILHPKPAGDFCKSRGDDQSKSWRVGCAVKWTDGGGVLEAVPEKVSIEVIESENSNLFADMGIGAQVYNAKEGDEWEADLEDEDVRVLTKIRSLYNFVQVLEVARRADHPLAGARILLLDRPGNIQSVYQPYKIVTDSYYDLFATLPPILPDGPVGILGLGAGTAARIIHQFWPFVQMHGWELDPTVVMVARQFFNLSELEDGDKPLVRSGSVFNTEHFQKDEEGESQISALKEEGTEAGTSERDGLEQIGKLVVHVGDALDTHATIEGGFAGLVVDIFSNGAVIPALQQPQTWQLLQERLRPGGRIMVNCGGSCVEAEGKSAKDGAITMEETIAAMTKIFPGRLTQIKQRGKGDNCIVLTGPHPSLQVWEEVLPRVLRKSIYDWVLVP